MKLNFAIFCFLTMTSTTLLANEIRCLTTIPPGNINFSEDSQKLNRIDSIFLSTGAPGPGGYGIILDLQGTSGTGKTPATEKIELSYSGSFGTELTEYSNSKTAEFSKDKPYIRFEIERSQNQNRILGALTVVFKSDSQRLRILTSRFRCR